jgi:hypothetical protein
VVTAAAAAAALYLAGAGSGCRVSTYSSRGENVEDREHWFAASIQLAVSHMFYAVQCVLPCHSVLAATVQ